MLCDYRELERKHFAKKLTDKELLATIPDAVTIIQPLLKELISKRQWLLAVVKSKHQVIEQTPDEMFQWFWKRWVDLNEGYDLSETNKSIARLRRLLALAQGLPTPRGRLTDELIEAARCIAVQSLLLEPARQRCGHLIALCPLHEERTPSFHIFPEQNRGWCFGCNDGGDVITLTMKLNKCGFKEAVLLLTGGNYARQ